MTEHHCSVIKNRTSSGDTSLYMLEGGSMRPAFRDGDILLIKKVLPASLKPGNVIVFDTPGQQKTLIHRVISLREDDTARLVFTQGDWSGRPDEPVQLQFVKGRVSARLSSGSFRPCRRYHEIFWLYSSRWYRSFRRFLKYLAVKLTQMMFPVLPIRVRTQRRGSKILRTAYLGKRKVWETRLNDRFRI